MFSTIWRNSLDRDSATFYDTYSLFCQESHQMINTTLLSAHKNSNLMPREGKLAYLSIKKRRRGNRLAWLHRKVQSLLQNRYLSSIHMIFFKSSGLCAKLSSLAAVKINQLVHFRCCKLLHKLFLLLQVHFPLIVVDKNNHTSTWCPLKAICFWAFPAEHRLFFMFLGRKSKNILLGRWTTLRIVVQTRITTVGSVPSDIWAAAQSLHQRLTLSIHFKAMIFY